jgi:pantetheine-phosphate adenylyltransferase
MVTAVSGQWSVVRWHAGVRWTVWNRVNKDWQLTTTADHWQRSTDHQQLAVHLFHLPFAIYQLTSISMRRAIYPGSFDPVTNGHLDIIERGCKLFDEIIIAILINPEKQPFFSIEERRQMLNEVLKGINRASCKVRVDAFEGLLVQYALAQKANAIVRGIRAISDYEYELQMALMNRRLEPTIETVFMMPAETYSYVSSRLVKEVFQLGGKLTGLVPSLVQKRMKEKVGKR